MTSTHRASGPDHHRRHADDRGAALAVTLATIMLVMILSALVAGAVVSQIGASVFGQKNTRTAHAAEAGLDAGLGAIRASWAVDTLEGDTAVGYRVLLPCNGTASWTTEGQVVGAPGDVAYQVTIRYFADDRNPTGRDEAWLDANALPCAVDGVSELPAFAHITSLGSGSDTGQRSEDAGERTLVTVYDFSTTNENIPGGLIHRERPSGSSLPDLCLDSGSAAPAVGAALRWELCADNDPSQIFWWRKDFTILQSSTVNLPGGALCVTSSANATTTQSVTMAPCQADFKPQQWGQTSEFGFGVHPRHPGNSTRYCLLVGNNNAPGAATATTGACSMGLYNTRSGMRPDASVGAGSAGDIGDTVSPNTGYQWVNYDEFGRCYDLPNWNGNTDQMTVSPCKQSPIRSTDWNQVLHYEPATRQMWVRTGPTGQTYLETTGPLRCLEAPPVSATQGYTRMRACQSPAGPVQQWTVNRDTGVYAASYTIVDGVGRCLSLDQRPDVGIRPQWSEIIVEACDGSDKQKWNAPPGERPASVRDTRELS